jgi:hypothetical protein
MMLRRDTREVNRTLKLAGRETFAVGLQLIDSETLPVDLAWDPRQLLEAPWPEGFVATTPYQRCTGSTTFAVTRHAGIQAAGCTPAASGRAG